MDNDDLPVGRLLSRRDALKLLGLGGAALLSACSTGGTATSMPTAALPTAAVTAASTQAAATAASTAVTALDCVVKPEMTIGPYFVDGMLNRSDVRTDSAGGEVKAGLPLTLNIVVARVENNACAPLEGAQVDIWHCDAAGQYSGVTDRGFQTTGQDFLRGYQVTGADGRAQFQTIYPGWYSGRAVHIHFTIRTAAADGNAYQFTSQFFFDDALSDQMYMLEPYAAKGQRDTLNSRDSIYSSGGDQLLLNLQGDLTNGFTTGMNIGLDLTDMNVGDSDMNSGGPP